LISARVFRISLALDYLFVLPQVYLSAPNPNAPPHTLDQLVGYGLRVERGTATCGSGA
jgi:hypothetical protein